MTRTVLGGGRIFDGTGSPISDGDVAFEDGRIVDVGPDLDGDERVDVAGMTLLPGMFDCHTHVVVSDVDIWGAIQRPYSYRYYAAARNLAATLRAGITSARDAGGADLGIKQALADGLIPGPRLQVSLSMISQTGGHGDDWYPSGVVVPWLMETPGIPSTLVDGPDEMRRTVRTLIRQGADVIKVATSGGVLSARDDPRHAHFRDDELDVLVAEATAAEIGVMAHAQATDGIKAAIRSGMRSIEHGIYLDDEAIEMMLARGTYLVPTLVAPTGVVTAAEQGQSVPEPSVRKAREVIEIHRESFRRAVEAGVRIAFGTDSGVTPHGENLRELQLMVDGGMDPQAAIRSATRTAAELLGVQDELGTLEVGKRADVVVVEGDVTDVSTLRERIRDVYQDGVRVTVQ